MKKTSTRKPKNLAEFSYTSDVLAFDTVIQWLRTRASITKDAKKHAELMNAIPFLEKQRQAASRANNTKSIGYG